jgi:sugar lactone lactonase YvrE
MLSGAAGIALMPEPDGGLTIFIADYYNGLVRAVGPDGIIRNVSDEGQSVFGQPTRVAFAPRRRWLYVTDSSRDKIIVVNIPSLSPNLVPPRPLGALAPPKKGG